jgi:hypothetical protein
VEIQGSTLSRARQSLTEGSLSSARRARLSGVVAVLSLMMASLVTLPAQAAAPTWYQDHVYSTGATAATADKPQSKVWFNDGSWWALMVTSGGTVNIHKLVNHVWTNTGTVVDDRASSTGDALWSGSKLYVISRTSGTAGAVRAYRFRYSGGVYTQEFNKPFSGGGTESATIDKDQDGRLWVTFTRASVVYVMHSDVDQAIWTEPFRISGADTSVAADDISAVIAFEGKIGVMWSDQASNAMRFAYHVDGAADNSWTLETVLSGTGIADDHINIKSLVGDSAGRLYAAVKTSNTVATDPIIYVVTRGATGTWTAQPTATVADKLTRPQLALDSTNRVVYIMQSTEGGGTVYYKSAAMADKPAFSGSGKGSTFITWTGAKINNVSTTKDPVSASTGLVAIAADEFAHRYYHAEMSLGTATDTTPPPAPSVTPASGSYTSAQSATMSDTETGAVIRYTVAPGTTAPADPTSTSTVYSGPITVSASQVIKARAYDAAGNASPVTQRNYTITTAPNTTTLVVNPEADTMVKQGTVSTNYGTTTPLQADSQDVAGKASAINSYLRFTVPALAAGQSITGASLSLKVTNGTPNGPAIYRTVTTPVWNESTMTWSSGRPARSGSAVGNFTSVGVARVSTPLTGVTASGPVSLELAPEATDGMDFVSRESTTTADRPQLVLTIASS